MFFNIILTLSIKNVKNMLHNLFCNMKKNSTTFIEKVKQIIINIGQFCIKKSLPLQKLYIKYSKTKYGRLIRMDSFYVYPMLFLPTWCAIWIADQSTNFMSRLLLCLVFAIGSFIMRSIGCILNDIADIKIDREITRTKNRPLASGEIKIYEAINLVLIMSGLALSILLTLPTNVFVIGVIGALMTILYPFAKRFTHLPQIILGFTFNIGVLMAWLTVNNQNYLPLILLYIGFAIFTFGYDTIYACQDLEEDLKNGVKSFAVLLKLKNKDIKATVWKIYRISISFIGISGLSMPLNSSFFFGLAAALYVLYNSLESCDISNKKLCAEHFKNSTIFLFILFLGTVFGK